MGQRRPTPNPEVICQISMTEEASVIVPILPISLYLAPRYVDGDVAVLSDQHRLMVPVRENHQAVLTTSFCSARVETGKKCVRITRILTNYLGT